MGQLSRVDLAVAPVRVLPGFILFRIIERFARRPGRWCFIFVLRNTPGVLLQLNIKATGFSSLSDLHQSHGSTCEGERGA